MSSQWNINDRLDDEKGLGMAEDSMNRAKPREITSVVAPVLKTYRNTQQIPAIENTLRNMKKERRREWKEDELIHAMLSMLQTNKRCSFIISRLDGSVSMDPCHCVQQHNCTHSMSAYMTPLLQCHQQVKCLWEFGTRKSEGVLEMLQEVVIQLLSEHNASISKLQATCSLNVCLLPYSVHNETRAICTMYDVLCDAMSSDYTYKTMDCVLERLLSASTYAQVHTPAVLRVLGAVQKAVLVLLNRVLDSVFNKGCIDEPFTNQLVFHNTDEGVAVRETSCSLWTLPFITSLIKASRDAKRLRSHNIPITTHNFSYYMNLYGTVKSAFIPAVNIVRSMEQAARRCACDNAKQLFDLARRDNALGLVLQEIEMIFTGFALREMAFDLFGATRDESSPSVVLSFYNSLQLSFFAESSLNRWTLRSHPLQQLYITPKLPWPVQYIVEESFIDTANQCVGLLLKLMRAKEILSRIRIEEDKRTTGEYNTRELYHLVNITAQPLTSMAELLFTQLQGVINKKISLVLHSHSIDEAQEHMLSLQCQLNHIVSREGKGRCLVHESMSELCAVADHLEASIKERVLDNKQIQSLNKTVHRHTQLLIGLGSNMQATIFNVLTLFI